MRIGWNPCNKVILPPNIQKLIKVQKKKKKKANRRKKKTEQDKVTIEI